MPADVHLRNLTGTVTTSSTTSGGNALRSAVQAPAVELSGCTTSQTGVARLMSRLHDVRGVTRVTLSSSARPSPRRPRPPAEADGDRLCPKGSPPDFSIVIFFERVQLGAGATAEHRDRGRRHHRRHHGPGTTTTATATATPAAGTAADDRPDDDVHLGARKE